ncbi:MAG: GGDEF domain-containing protein [Actinomycetota bacterium]
MGGEQATADQTTQRVDARLVVDELMLRAQRNDPHIDADLDAAIDGAQQCPEVLVPLLHVALIRALTTDRDVWTAMETLEREARRHRNHALLASALIHRVEYEANDDIVATRFEVLVEARILLDDTSSVPRDRVAGLIVLAIRLCNLRLYENAIDTLEQAVQLAEDLGRPDDRMRPLTMNRALTSSCMALDAIEAGEIGIARRCLGQVERIAADPGVELPPAWTLEIEAYRILLTALIDGDELDPDVVEALIDRLELDPRRVPMLLRLATPASSWVDEPDLDTVEPRVETFAHFLYGRALERSQGDSPALRAARRHAQLLAAQAWHMRAAAGAALSAQIDAARLTDENQVLRAQALTDQLTGTGNRRAFFNRIAERKGRPATVLSIDLDGFKTINDLHGHAVGDVVLQRVSAALAEPLGVSLGDTDLVSTTKTAIIARLGGDEFAVAIDGDDQDHAADVVSQLSEAVNALDWSDLLGTEGQTVSIGFACGSYGTELLESSDLAMYVRKAARTQTGVAENS